MKKYSAQQDQSPFEESETFASAEKPDAWWYRVYAAVVLTTLSVISALWLFSSYFSK